MINDDTNRVSSPEIQRILGRTGYDEIVDVYRHITKTVLTTAGLVSQSQDLDPEFDFRYAPSLVARSEAELFGISLPRFAFRTHLGLNGFINARRLNSLQESLGSTWGKRLDPGPGETALIGVTAFVSPDASPSQKLRASSCIGDSLLIPPSELLNHPHFHVLTTELGISYGEGSRITGTPFVKHISLGGGLCAQAACLMCSMLMQDFVRGIYGVAEITALTREDDSCCEFELSGLTPRDIVHYFRNSAVGLCASNEKLHKAHPFGDQDERLLIEAVYAYVRSGFPVIVPVDMRRLAAAPSDERWGLQSVYERNNIVSASQADSLESEPLGCDLAGAREPAGFWANSIMKATGVLRRVLSRLPNIPQFKEIRCRNGKKPAHQRDHPQPVEVAPSYHAVVVVGCGYLHTTLAMGPAHLEAEFLLNDPAHHPFIFASARQLLLSRAYKRIRKEDPLAQDKLARFQFISVRPPEARLPLVQESHHATNMEQVYHDGLLKIAWLIQNDPKSYIQLNLPAPVDGGPDRCRFPGTVRLLHLGTRNENCDITAAGFDMDVIALLRATAIEHPALCQWVWVQQLSYAGNPEVVHDVAEGAAAPVNVETLWIWDAQVAPSKIGPSAAGGIAKYLLATFSKRQSWCETFVRKPRSEETDEHAPQVLAGTCSDERAMREELKDSSEPAELKTGIISSFSIKGIKQASRLWPKRHTDGRPFPCEIYCFMLHDLQSAGVLGGISGKAAWTSAVDFMAAHSRDEVKVMECAKRIGNALSISANAPIESIASFIPEVTNGLEGGDRGANKAAMAIEFLIRLARALRIYDRRHTVSTVELVGGSRIASIWAGERNEASEEQYAGMPRPRYFASRLSESTGIDRLLTCMKEALISTHSDRHTDAVRLAVELEPGPLYLLRSLGSLHRFLDAFTAQKEFASVQHLIGFNLDVAHWRMVGITPDDLRHRENRVIRDRILHAHIGGHHRCAHLGDAPLGEDYGLESTSLTEWIQLISEINAERHTNGSGEISVSLEYEAARNVCLVELSANELKRRIETAPAHFTRSREELA